MRDCWPAPRPITGGLVRGRGLDGREEEGDTLAVQGVADGVGLCIFEGDCCDSEVSQSGVREGRGVFWCDY